MTCAPGCGCGFPPPPDPALEAAFGQFVREHAARYGWPTGKTERIQRGDPDHARHPGHPGRADPPQRRRAAVPDQALGRRGRRRAGRGRDARGGPRAGRGALVPRGDRGPARADAARTGRLVRHHAQRLGHPAAVQASLGHHRRQPAALGAARPAPVGRSSTSRCARSAATTCSPSCRRPAQPRARTRAGPAVDLRHPEGPQAGLRQPDRPHQRTPAQPGRSPAAVDLEALRAALDSAVAR